MTVKIRRAVADDPSQAGTVLRRSITELCYLEHGGDEANLSKWLSNKTIENVSRWILQSHFFVAEDAGRIVGVAAVSDAGKITLNYVDPDFGFRGVSKALVLSMEEQARTLGLAECCLESSKTALRFYQELGYVKSEQSCTAPATASPATILSKRLSL